MATYKGGVVATENLQKSCGHFQEFLHYQDDPYRKERREKFMQRHCRACGEKANREHNARQQMETKNGKVKKGQEVKRLPEMSMFFLRRRPDGSWHGCLEANGVTVEGEMGGVMGLVQKLARKWLQEQGAQLQGKVKG